MKYSEPLRLVEKALIGDRQAATHAIGGLPRWPKGWYVVARTRDLPPGAVCSGELADRPYVLFRTEKGKLGALDAHCPHMGAHLKYGKVVGETIRCSLHHWKFSVQGRCTSSEDAGVETRSWRAEERYGLIFLFLGDNVFDHSLPCLSEESAYRWITGSPVELTTDWHCMVVNGFDMSHLQTVHNRELIQAAQYTNLDNRCLELTYRARVTGREISDLVMKWLSKDNIRIRQRCYGPIVFVETDLGFTRTAAVFGILTIKNGVRAYGAFGVEPGPALRLRLVLARWLFTAFLRRDFQVVQDMRLCVDVEDEGVQRMATYLRSLPQITQ